MDPAKIKQTERLVLALCKKTEERNGKRTVLGECVLRFIDEPEVIIKDNGELFDIREHYMEKRVKWLYILERLNYTF